MGRRGAQLVHGAGIRMAPGHARELAERGGRRRRQPVALERLTEVAGELPDAADRDQPIRLHAGPAAVPDHGQRGFGPVLRQAASRLQHAEIRARGGNELGSEEARFVQVPGLGRRGVGEQILHGEPHLPLFQPEPCPRQQRLGRSGLDGTIQPGRDQRDRSSRAAHPLRQIEQGRTVVPQGLQRLLRDRRAEGIQSGRGFREARGILQGLLEQLAGAVGRLRAARLLVEGARVRARLVRRDRARSGRLHAGSCLRRRGRRQPVGFRIAAARAPEALQVAQSVLRASLPQRHSRAEEP